MPYVVAIANQKGGVGKTTTAVNLAASLAAAEKRVLLIDLDPQGNASSGLGLPRRDPRPSLYAVLLDQAPLGSAIRRSVHLPNLDVISATRDLAAAEVELGQLPDRIYRLRRALAGFRDLYDYILVDCPPALGLLTLNALAAADSVIVPLQPEFFALEGLASFAEFLHTIRERVNTRLHVEGILLTLYDGRLKLSREVEQEATAIFGGAPLRTRIPRNVTLAEAPGFGKPAITYDLASPGAQAYLSLASELIARHEKNRAADHRSPQDRWSRARQALPLQPALNRRTIPLRDLP